MDFHEAFDSIKLDTEYSKMLILWLWIENS